MEQQWKVMSSSDLSMHAANTNVRFVPYGFIDIVADGNTKPRENCVNLLNTDQTLGTVICFKVIKM